MVYGIQWNVSKAAFNIIDTDYEIVEDNAFYRVGDQSRFAHIKYNGEVQGHILVARKKYAIYTFILSGYILDQPEIWHELFDERINQLPRHAPEFKFNFSS